MPRTSFSSCRIVRSPEVGTLPWTSPVIRAAQPVWDKIMSKAIEREQIKAELDVVVPEAQKALDDARARLG